MLYISMLQVYHLFYTHLHTCVMSDTFMLNHIPHRSHFDPINTSMVMLNNYMYHLFHSFPPFLTFKHYVLYKLSPIILSYFSRTTPLLSLMSIVTHYILFNTPLNPFLNSFLIFCGYILSSPWGMHVSGWRHVATCTFPVLWTDSMSLDGGTLSTCTLPVASVNRHISGWRHAVHLHSP